MSKIKRRGFLRAATGMGLASAATALSVPLARGQSKSPASAEVLIDPLRSLADLDRRLFGSFLEHIGRAIYTGVFEPGSKLADESGFRKDVLDLSVKSAGYEAPGVGAVPYLDVAGTFDPEANRVTILLLNRDLEHDREVTLVWQGMVPSKVLACQVLTGPDLKAENSFDEPARVAPRELDPPRLGPRTLLKLPPRSYSVLHLGAG